VIPQYIVEQLVIKRPLVALLPYGICVPMHHVEDLIVCDWMGCFVLDISVLHACTGAPGLIACIAVAAR
jgi:hypothetical protein